MRIFTLLLGLILIVFGVATILLPLPTGAISIVIGLALITAASRTVRRWLKRRRKKSRRLDKFLKRIQKVLPKRLADPLRETESDENDEEGQAQQDPEHTDSGDVSSSAAIAQQYLEATHSRRRPAFRAPHNVLHHGPHQRIR